MIAIGKKNTLRIQKFVEFGAYLDGGEKYGEILLPIRYCPKEAALDDMVEVFIYFDSEDRIIATTEFPYAEIDQLAYLQVKDVNSIGAFLDWGLMKDLLVPFREQPKDFEVGKKYIVYVYLDNKTNRLVASGKYQKFLDLSPAHYKEGETVSALVVAKTPLGYRMVINNIHSAMIFDNDVFSNIRIGDVVEAYIKTVREDGKIDLQLQKPGYEKVDDISKLIFEYLAANEGKANLSDKTPAETIYNLFGISKKSFKMALGKLYKAKIIIIDDMEIRLNK